MAAHQEPGSARRHRRPRWWMRLLAVLLGLSVCVLAEVVCVIFDWGRPTNYDDPFVGFSAVHPLFVLDESAQEYRIAKSRQAFFAPDSFPARKAPGTFRIFCLGGSTVQGRPWSIETSFTGWLKMSLNAADPTRTWEVVNCGGISYASYRLIPILQECLAYQPDLLILCSGHNEFLEDRTYDHIKNTPRALALPQQAVSRLRTYTSLRAGALHLKRKLTGLSLSERPLLKDEVDPLLDYNDGLRAYHRDHEWRADVIRHYEHNLRRMIELAHGAGVPVVLARPPSNLSDCPPFKSQHRDGLSEPDAIKAEILLAEAGELYRGQPAEALVRIQKAIAIDDQYAFAFFALGKCQLALGHRREAGDAFLQARELDICPLRMLAPMERALAAVAQETGTPLIDTFALLERECPSNILGDDILVDHIHPSFRGHQLIADALLAEMTRQNWIVPASDWQPRRQEAWDRHLSSLSDFYFERGERTLQMVWLWTQGRADGPSIGERSINARSRRHR